MATPVVTVTLDQSTPYAPGSPIVATWVVVDADNSTEQLRLEGTDAQGNTVTVNLDVQRQDTFTATRVYWVRTGVNLGVDNGNRRATGVVPTA